MPKNKSGGRNYKKLANKNTNSDYNTNVRYSKDKDEIYARVTKIFGNGMAEIVCHDNVIRLLQIRKKFRGRNKRDNIISIDSIILGGLRSWEVLTGKKKENVDLLYVYSPNQYNSLTSIPDINKIMPGYDKLNNLDQGFEFSDKPTWLIKQEEAEMDEKVFAEFGKVELKGKCKRKIEPNTAIIEKVVLASPSAGTSAGSSAVDDDTKNKPFDFTWDSDDSDAIDCFLNEI